MRNVLLIASILGIASPGNAVDSVVYKNQEIALPEFRQRTLALDAPITDAIFDAKHGVWLTGKSSVWNWNLQTQRLTRIPIVSKQDDSFLRHLTYTNGRLYAASDRYLFRIQLNPKRVVKFGHPQKFGRSYGLNAREGVVWWLHEGGLIKLNPEQKPQLIAKWPKAASGGQSYFDLSNHLLWTTRGNVLVSHDFRHSPAKRKIIHRAKTSFLKVAGAKNIFAYTNNAVLRFSDSGSLNQIIPVEGERKLIAAHISAEKHAYLFNDRLLEIYDTTTKQRIQTKLRLRSGASVKGLLIDREHIAVLYDDLPALFRLNKFVNVAREIGPAEPKKL